MIAGVGLAVATLLGFLGQFFLDIGSVFSFSGSILALDADLIFISGKVGTEAFSKRFDVDFSYLGSVRFDSTYIRSVRHMSRVRYAACVEDIGAAVIARK